MKFVEEAVKTENQKLIFDTPPDCLHGDGVHGYEFNEGMRLGRELSTGWTGGDTNRLSSLRNCVSFNPKNAKR